MDTSQLNPTSFALSSSTLTPQNIKKQFLIQRYNENRTIDELRQRCHNNKSTWDHLPFQDLHIKLDILEKRFLFDCEKQKQRERESRDGNKENSGIPQEFETLGWKVRNQRMVPDDIRQKMEQFLGSYWSLRQENQDKVEKIDEMRKTLNRIRKNKQKLYKQVEQEEVKFVKASAECLQKQKIKSNIDKKLHLIF